MRWRVIQKVVTDGRADRQKTKLIGSFASQLNSLKKLKFFFKLKKNVFGIERELFFLKILEIKSSFE